MRLSRCTASVLLAGLAIAQLGHAQTSHDPNGATPPLPRHWIVFAHHRDDERKDYDIWRVAADGTLLASLVVLPQDQFAISPDGNELVYATNSDGHRSLWRRKLAGGECRSEYSNVTSMANRRAFLPVVTERTWRLR